MSKARFMSYLIPIVFSVIFLILALSLNFTQDDAYISFQYVKNFLDNQGLVFNPGEFVEGYTNFFYIILMIFFELLGLNLILTAKILGLFSGIVIFWVGRAWLYDKEENIFSHLTLFCMSLLLSACLAFAYWAISGLETLFFAALIFYGLYLASKRNLMYIVLMAVATLTRPEGFMVFVLILVYLWWTKAYRFKYIACSALAYALLIIPHLFFRYFYYDDFLPNPFYAKTGWSWEYLSSGIDYIWLFIRQYGFYGLLFLLPLAGYKLIAKHLRLLFLVGSVYLLYILLIGGDVLHGFRFFIPILPMWYLLFSAVLIKISQKLFTANITARSIIIMAAAIFLGSITFLLPRERMTLIRRNEIALVNNMKYLANTLGQVRFDRYSIGCSTIGAFSYYSRARVIDMLGLTDRAIAKNPQPFVGIASTWKERNYNIAYLMKRNPDLILFSTGLKPSAPAEKALFLSSRFRNGYYPVFHGLEDGLWTAYKRKPDYKGVDKYFADAEFINLYSEALNRKNRGANQLAFEYARQSLEKGPADFYLPLILIGRIYMEQGEYDEGVKALKRAFELSDGYAMTACDMLRYYYEKAGDSTAAGFYEDYIRRYNRL